MARQRLNLPSQEPAPRSAEPIHIEIWVHTELSRMYPVEQGTETIRVNLAELLVGNWHSGVGLYRDVYDSRLGK